MKKFFSIGLFIICLLITSTNLVNAKLPEDYNLITQKTLPTSPSYSFKRIKEKALMFVKLTSKSKFEYSKVLLGKRLSELVTLVNDKDPNLITSSSQRFSYQAGITAKLNSKLKESQKDNLTKLFANYNIILGELRDNYPANKPNWLLTQQNIDTLNILLGEMK